jgi:acetolactate synthase-1/3 small subunit
LRHVLSVMVENQAGVLARVAGMFSRRGYNIESLTVGTTENPKISRMTIVVEGDAHVIEQVTKQLHKLIEVIKVSDITNEEYIDRELVLIKVHADLTQRGEIMQIVDIFRARIVDLGPKSLVIEATGDQGKISAIEASLKPFGIKEMVRCGKVAMVRGVKSKVE